MLALCLVLLAAVLSFCLGPRPKNASVNLVFLGYTNETNQIVMVAPGPGSTIRPIPGMKRRYTALLLTTNSGSVAVQVYAAVRAASFGIAGFAPTMSTGSPRLLKPAESTLIAGVADPLQGPWWTEVSYQRHGAREKVYGLGMGFSESYDATNDRPNLSRPRTRSRNVRPCHKSAIRFPKSDLLFTAATCAREFHNQDPAFA